MTSDPFAGALGESLAARWQLERDIQLDTDTQPHGRAVLLAELEIADGTTRPGLLARLTAAVAAGRFRAEQAGLVPAAFADDSPHQELRAAIGAERTRLARQLAWAAPEVEAAGVPEPATLGALRAQVATVRDLDVQLWGPVVDPWAHHTWPGPRGPRAPWAGSGTIPATVADVAVLLLLGADAVWHDGSVGVRSGADAATGWGYELVDDGTAPGRSWVVAAPDIAAWQRARRRAGGDQPR